MTQYLLLLIKDIWATFRGRIVILVALMMASSLMEGLAFALLLPLLILIGVGGSENGTLVLLLRKVVTALSLPLTPMSLLLLIVGVAAMQMLVLITQSWLAARLQHAYTATWRETLFSTYMNAGWPFFVRSRSGDLINTIIGETNRVGGAFYLISQLLSAAMVTAVYLTVAFYASWEVTGLLLLSGSLLFLFTHRFMSAGYRIGEEISTYSSDLECTVNEFMGGAKLVKATATEGLAQSKFVSVIHKLRDVYFWSSFYPSILKGIFEFSAISVLCVVLVVGTHSLRIDSASILLIVALFVRLVPRAFSLQQNLQLLGGYLPSIETIAKSHDVAVSYQETLTPMVELPPLNGEGATVSIHDLSFSYGDKQVLRSVRMDFPQGKTIGIVGSSGSGKSTLVDCILRLNETVPGMITAQNIPIHEFPLKAWRRRIGYVSQETFLFHDTVRNNMLWGSGNLKEVDMVEAARKAYAHDFIMALSDEYETVVGDRGMRLSVGQKQRIGLARALMNRPALLILDEATSALDSESEQYVLDAIQALHGEMTIIMIAHRLSTVKNADRIYVLEGGKVVECGTWAELLAQKTRFSALWELQQAGH